MLLQLQPAPEARSADRQVHSSGLWSLVLSVYVSEGSLAAGQLLALLTLLAVYRVIRSSCQTHAGYGESSLANRGGCGGVAVQTSYRPQERRQGQLGLLICLPKVAGPNPRPCHHRILIGITGTPGTRSHGQIAAIGFKTETRMLSCLIAIPMRVFLHHRQAIRSIFDTSCG